MTEATIIIPTAGTATRASSLMRAIDSVATQVAAAAVPLVLLNGDRYHTDVQQWLSGRRDIRYHYIPEGNLPNALRIGRELVDTPYFGFLDDDDIYLPHAVRTRLRPFIEDCETDVVITNGFYQHADGTRHRCIEKLPSVSDDLLLHCICHQNWLASCGGLFRTDGVEPTYFAALAKYFEWTNVAFCVAETKKLKFLEEETFIVFESDNSLWKSNEIVFERIRFIEKLMASTKRREIRRALQRKLSNAYHDASGRCLTDGELDRAWKYHFLSLNGRYGINYLFFSRKLVGASMNNLLRQYVSN